MSHEYSNPLPNNPLIPRDDAPTVQQVLDAIRNEVRRAAHLHAPMHSGHEAYAVIKEEFEEMWNDIKIDDIAHAQKEALQIAAMCVRFIVDVPTDFATPKPGARPLTKQETTALRSMLGTINMSFAEVLADLSKRGGDGV